jgi:signal transduction histidine kinase/DNA-binding response OmpR family regulator/ligand-binding sensor domain-containing protein
MIKYILLFHAFLLSFCASAQKANFQFYNTADGLSGNFTQSLVQDDQGFIWVLNDFKLHRFDGRNFVLFPPPPAGLPGSKAPLEGMGIYEDSLLFFRSRTHLFLLNPKTGDWQSFPQPAGNGESVFLRGGGIYKKHDGQVLVFSKDMDTVSIWHFRNRNLEPTANIGMPYDGSIIQVDPLDNLYIHSGGRLLKRAGAGRQEVEISLEPYCKDYTVAYVHTDSNGVLNILINSPQIYNGIFTLKPGEATPSQHSVNRFISNPQIRLSAFLMEKNGNLWACGPDKNLVYYDAKQDTLYNFREELKLLLPAANAFLFPFSDRTGTVWVVTRLGLLKVTLQSSAFDQYFARPEEVCEGYCSFRGIAEDDQGTIYARFYNGIARFDPELKKEFPLYPFQHPFPFGIHVADSAVWLNNGQLLDMRTGAMTATPGSQNKTADDGLFSQEKNGRLWWAYGYEVFYLDTSGGKMRWKKEIELPQKNIPYTTEALHAGQYSGKIWIGHRGNLLQYAPDAGTQQWFGPDTWGFPVSRILVIEEDQDGTVWLGADVGLIRFDPGAGQTKQYTVKDGLPNDFVSGLLPDGDSCLWLSTNNGLSRFHIPTGSFINFFEEDGLTHNEFNRASYFKARNGRMFFGGLRGIIAFFPQELMREFRRRNEAAKVVLSSFEYVDEKWDTTLRTFSFGHHPEIHLYHWRRSFTFEYALTDFRNPLEVYYSYKMEGYEDTWSTPSNFNFTRFSSLPAGKYIFRVKARDSHGLWHPSQLAVAVVVHPPWWATWWAWSLYIILLIALLNFFRLYELNRQRLKYNLDIEKLEAGRLKELDSFKSRLYTNLTHEFRTPLTVILGMINQIRNDPKKYLDEGARLIEINGKNLLRLINQLLDLSKLEDKSFQLNLQHCDIVPYLRYVTESFQTYANSNNLSLRLFTSQESLAMDYDPEHIQQILANLLSNAVKFTPSDGVIKVKLSANEGYLNIEVADTGIGIAEKDLPNIFDRFYQVDGSHTREGEGTGIGLAHTQELVKLMGGEISAQSKLGVGTIFTVRLPIRSEAALAGAASSENAFLSPGFTQPVMPGSALQTPANREVVDSELPQLLLIEDNPDVVVYLESCLTGLYQLDVAYNGKIGVEKALENIPDLIISDVMMPEKDGYQVCDLLKNDERTSHIPIILLTAKADSSSKITGLRRGADAYLSKPFDKEELLVRLESLLERQKRMAIYFSKKRQGFDTSEITEAIQVEDAFVQKMRRIVEENYGDEDFGLPQLCQKIGMSRSQLFRKMKALMDESPSNFIRFFRLNKARTLLETTGMTVSEVAWKVGYKNLGHFSTSFQEEFGFSPSETNK